MHQRVSISYYMLFLNIYGMNNHSVNISMNSLFHKSHEIQTFKRTCKALRACFRPDTFTLLVNRLLGILLLMELMALQQRTLNL